MRVGMIRLMQRRHPQIHRPIIYRYIFLGLNVLYHGRTELSPSTHQQFPENSHSATSTDPARGALATLAALCRSDGLIAGCGGSTRLIPAPSPASDGPFTGGYDSPSEASLLDRSLTNAVLRSLAALVVSGTTVSPAGMAVEWESCAGGRHGGTMDDSDNRRRRFFSLVFKLLKDIACEDERQDVEWTGRCLGQEDTDLIWVRRVGYIFFSRWCLIPHRGATIVGSRELKIILLDTRVYSQGASK